MFLKNSYWLFFRGRKGDLFKIPPQVPRREGNPKSAAPQHLLGLHGTKGAMAGPTFPFTSEKCPPPVHCPIHQLRFPTRNQTCNPSPVCSSLDHGISFLVGNYHFTYSNSTFSEIKHAFEINRSLRTKEKFHIWSKRQIPLLLWMHIKHISFGTDLSHSA